MYRNKVYVSMDADKDIRYYYLMKAWKENENIDFCFYDAHEINNIYDKSEESIKAGLRKRFINTKVFVLLVGESTRFLYKYVRWEIEEAIKRNIPCIVVNLNGKKVIDNDRCPPVIRNYLAIHVPFNPKIIQYALNHWPSSHEQYIKEGKNGAYTYNKCVYDSLGI